MQYIRQKHSLLIGARTAEEVKEAIGRVEGRGEETLAVRAGALNTGLPLGDPSLGEETAEAFTPGGGEHHLRRPGSPERTPPELAADVAVGGILLTGGGSLLQGMDTLLAARTGWRPTGRGPHPRRGPGAGADPCRTWPNGRKGS